MAIVSLVSLDTGDAMSIAHVVSLDTIGKMAIASLGSLDTGDATPISPDGWMVVSLDTTIQPSVSDGVGVVTRSGSGSCTG